MLVRDEHDLSLSLYEIHHGETWYQIQKDAQPMIGNMQDAYGPIDDEQQFQGSMDSSEH